jgi:hypothetical protein
LSGPARFHCFLCNAPVVVQLQCPLCDAIVCMPHRDAEAHACRSLAPSKGAAAAAAASARGDAGGLSSAHAGGAAATVVIAPLVPGGTGGREAAIAAAAAARPADPERTAKNDALRRKVALTRMRARCPAPRDIAPADQLFLETRWLGDVAAIPAAASAAAAPIPAATPAAAGTGAGDSGGASTSGASSSSAAAGTTAAAVAAGAVGGGGSGSSSGAGASSSSKFMCASRLHTVARLLDAVAASHGVRNSNSSEADAARRLHLYVLEPGAAPGAGVAEGVVRHELDTNATLRALQDAGLLQSGDVVGLLRGRVSCGEVARSEP